MASEGASSLCGQVRVLDHNETFSMSKMVSVVV